MVPSRVQCTGYLIESERMDGLAADLVDSIASLDAGFLGWRVLPHTHDFEGAPRRLSNLYPDCDVSVRVRLVVGIRPEIDGTVSQIECNLKFRRDYCRHVYPLACGGLVLYVKNNEGFEPLLKCHH